MTDCGDWYYDLLQAGGPTILGSNMPAVREQVIDLLNTCGPSTGLFHEYEYKLAKKISEMVPSVEMFRMLGSSTEACMCAVRIARLKTGHKNILKMGGAYHGWSDQMTYGMRVPGTKALQSPGVPNFVFKHTNEFFPGDLKDLECKLRANKLNGGTAAVYLEPVGPESGTRPLSKEFIHGAVKLAHEYGALVIFDEVVTGFRIGPSGAQGYFGVDPDLTIFGKIIAGGYPGAGGVLFTPWLHGNRCPFEDPNAAGMFFGIRLETGKTELMRAVFEGVCYLCAGCSNARISASRPRRQVVGSPQNAGSVGAAAVMAVGLGLIPDLDAVKALVPAERVYQPDCANKAVYDRYFGVFKKLYHANQGMYRALREAQAPQKEGSRV